jgi:hypothetical protein
MPSFVSNLTALPLHGYACGIADLNPDAARSGPVGAIDRLRHDTLGAKLARVSEHGRPILDDVFVQQDACLGLAQHKREAARLATDHDGELCPHGNGGSAGGCRRQSSASIGGGSRVRKGQVAR